MNVVRDASNTLSRDQITGQGTNTDAVPAARRQATGERRKANRVGLG